MKPNSSRRHELRETPLQEGFEHYSHREVQNRGMKRRSNKQTPKFKANLPRYNPPSNKALGSINQPLKQITGVSTVAATALITTSMLGSVKMVTTP